MTDCPKDSPELTALIQQSVERVKRMTPDERAAMHRAQARSWIRGEAGMGDDADEQAFAEAIRNLDEPALARLKAEAAARIAFAEQWMKDRGL